MTAKSSVSETEEHGFLEEIYKKVGESDYLQDVHDWLSTGFLPLNHVISQEWSRGFPVGRVTEIFGGESSGKTLLATMALIETQRRDGLAVFLDYEHAFSIERAKTLGLSDDKNLWLYKQPETAEECFLIVEHIANTVIKHGIKKPVTIVVDSVAAMVTAAEAGTEFGEGNMKTKLSLADCMSQCLKKIAPIINRTGITLIFLNQTRDNPGVMFGDKKSTPGGNAMKFYASLRIKLTKGSKEKDKDGNVVGENVTAEAIKNKVGVPFRKCTWVTDFKIGINLELSHVNALEEMGRLGDSKGFVEFGGTKYRKSQLIEALREDRVLYAELLKMFEWE